MRLRLTIDGQPPGTVHGVEVDEAEQGAFSSPGSLS